MSPLGIPILITVGMMLCTSKVDRLDTRELRSLFKLEMSSHGMPHGHGYPEDH